MWWIALHAPALSLEAWLAGVPEDERDLPAALLTRHRVSAVNLPARSLGVMVGMRRSTALALVPGLRLGAADPARDAHALKALAHVLLSFTPQVAAASPQGLVAEVQASLRYFGGPGALWARLGEALAPLGHGLHLAHAPTARAASCLARSGPQPGPASTLPDRAWLMQQVQGLPVAVLAPELPLEMNSAWRETCEAMGLASLGDLWAQPRAGLVRRLGTAVLQVLDQLSGDQPHPHEWLRLPDRFASELELPARAEYTGPLLVAVDVLLVRLSAWLRARQARAQQLELLLHHATRLRASHLGEAGAHLSVLQLALGEPTADAGHWRSVLAERLAREPLAAPVLSLTLRCDHAVMGAPPDTDLFPELANPREGLGRLVERLQARLGVEGVTRLSTWPEHRPELAWRAEAAELPPARHPLLEAPPATARLTRPVWLMSPPEPLPERQSRPWLGTEPLRLLQGPERVEAGWWDQALAARDYFVAQLPAGELVWIYRLRHAPPQGQPGWFLHGRFA